MADAKRAAFSCETPPYVIVNKGHHYGRSFGYGAAGAQAVAGNCTSLVLPQPLSRHARRAALPGVHGYVKQA
jgi:hypothetical protein